MFASQAVQYICSHCRTMLKENTSQHIDIERISEDCPSCGHALKETLTLSRSRPALESVPEMKTIAAVPVLTFGEKALDDFFLGIREGEPLCITGPYEGLLTCRLCVRALLPKREGGLGKSRIMFIDGGNCSDIYQCVNFARQYGLDTRRVLDGIVVSRTFTIYQLASLIINELPSAIAQYGVKLVVLSGLLALFLQDPQLEVKDAKRLLLQMAAATKRVSDQAILIVTTAEPTSEYEDTLSNFADNRLQIDGVEDGKKNLCIAASTKYKEKRFEISKEALTLVVRRA